MSCYRMFGGLRNSGMVGCLHYISINTFTPIEGKFQEFLELQNNETAKLSLKSSQCGWLGNDIFASQDGKKVIIVTRFKDKNSAENWWQQSDFQVHLATIKPLLKSVETMPVYLFSSNTLK